MKCDPPGFVSDSEHNRTDGASWERRVTAAPRPSWATTLPVQLWPWTTCVATRQLLLPNSSYHAKVPHRLEVRRTSAAVPTRRIRLRADNRWPHQPISTTLHWRTNKRNSSQDTSPKRPPLYTQSVYMLDSAHSHGGRRGQTGSCMAGSSSHRFPQHAPGEHCMVWQV